MIGVPAKESIGKRYGRMLVQSIKRRKPKREAYARCRCECGTVKTVRLASLRNGMIKSCGCYQRENSRRKATKHGMRYRPEYKIWQSMWERCTKPNVPGYKNYGGRGIRVCARWKSFEKFFIDMGPKPEGYSIERKNNNGNYTPKNCAWVTRLVQGANTRHARYLTFNGVRLHMSEWARRKGLTVTTLYHRLRAGWPLSVALTESAPYFYKRKGRMERGK